MSRMMHKLPVSAYTSQDWFDREQREIFSKTWRYACFIEDIAEPGDYISVQAGLNNIFIVMGHDQRLRAFHNICRHRGTQLIRAVGKTKKALTCPYHDWTYDLDGNLISVPDEKREFEGIDKSCLGLKPAAVDVWRGMIFVHPDPDTGSITEWVGDLEPKFGPHAVDKLPEYKDARTSYEIKANWKIVVENYIDVYHLSHLHSGTLSMYDHAKAKYKFVGPHYAFWEPPSERYGADIKANAPYPLVIPSEQAGAWVPMLFPGIGLAETESIWATFIVKPLAPELTRVENRVRVANASIWEFGKQALRSNSFWSGSFGGKYKPDPENKDDPMTSGDLVAEDVYACEQQQKSLKSPYFEVGPVSVGESPIIGHQEIILNWLEGKK